MKTRLRDVLAMYHSADYFYAHEFYAHGAIQSALTSHYDGFPNDPDDYRPTETGRVLIEILQRPHLNWFMSHADYENEV